jgi:hypothetical protein
MLAPFPAAEDRPDDEPQRKDVEREVDPEPPALVYDDNPVGPFQLGREGAGIARLARRLRA